jgi:hypothetical protein
MAALRFPKALQVKRADLAFMEFARQRQHNARIPTPESPLKQASVLIELNDISQPLGAR